MSCRESFAVILSAAKNLALTAQDEIHEGSLSAYLFENTQGQILRCAQNDSFEEFFRKLLTELLEIDRVTSR